MLISSLLLHIHLFPWGNLTLTCGWRIFNMFFCTKDKLKKVFFIWNWRLDSYLVGKQHLRRRERVSLRKYCHVEKANDDSKFVKVKKASKWINKQKAHLRSWSEPCVTSVGVRRLSKTLKEFNKRLRKRHSKGVISIFKDFCWRTSACAPAWPFFM